MNTSEKNRKVVALFKGGIAGAFALSGLCVTLIILGLTVRSPFISEVYLNTFAKCSLRWLLITTGGVGFIFGVIARKSFLRVQRIIIIMAIAAVPLIAGAWMLDAISKGVSIPHVIKLADCTNAVLNIHLMVPKGHNFHLSLNPATIETRPNGTVTTSYRFSGHMRITREGTTLADLPIGSDKAWLTRSGYVLTGAGRQNTNVPPLNKFIQQNKGYDFEIHLDPTPPPGSSIWLYWLQSRMDG